MIAIVGCVSTSTTLCSVHCALYTVLCTLCSLHCALYTVLSTLCASHCALYTVLSTLCALLVVRCMYLEEKVDDDLHLNNLLNL